MSKTSKRQKLLEPIRIGPMKLKNRLVMPPMGTNLGTRDGYVTQRTKDYYEERAKGGVGMVIVEVACIDSPVGKRLDCQLAIDDDKFIPGLRELAEVIKRHGARAAIQLHHAGRDAKQNITHVQPVAPSPVAMSYQDQPRELTVEEIREIIDRFAKGAKRAQQAGFDAIQIHGAHGYLVNQFLSPAANKRTDKYGGDVNNRARFLIEIITAIRAAVGPDYPVLCRIDGKEYGLEGGIDLEDSVEVARLIEEAGVQAIHVSGIGYGSKVMMMTPGIESAGVLVPLAEAVKGVVKVPVSTVGGIDPQLAERVLQERKADLVERGRGLIADPELPNKVASGRSRDILPCISCLKCEDYVAFKQVALRCSVNAAAGREREYKLTPAERKKRIVVVGGGPAGLEAARVAALRGHEVVLYERESKLGGQMILAAKPPHKEGIRRFIGYLENQIQKLDVQVELGKEADTELILGNKPEVAIIATGVLPFIPDIAGIGGDNVVTALDVLAGRAKVGDSVVIIGGETVGCETADFLAEKAKKVTVVRRGRRMATKMVPLLRRPLLDRLASKGVTMMVGASYREITSKGIALTDQDGQRRTLEADTIILAAGARPNAGLCQLLEGKVAKVCLAGDCAQPRGILEAIDDGYRIAKAI